MSFARSIPPLLVIFVGGVIVFGLPLVFHLVLQPRYHVLDGRPALDLLLKALPWTFTLIVWWGFTQGERNIREILRTRGVVAPATVTWVRDDGTEEKGAPVLELFVRVTPEAGEPFDATVKAVVSAAEPIRPGVSVLVRYDPENPKWLVRLEK